MCKEWETFGWFLTYKIDFESQILVLFDSSPLTQFLKFNNFLWVCWFLGKNLSNFVPPNWKLYNPYYHNVHIPMYSQKTRQYVFFSLIRFEIFPKTCILTYKSWKKYLSHRFIQDHTVIRATRVHITNWFFCSVLGDPKLAWF